MGDSTVITPDLELGFEFRTNAYNVAGRAFSTARRFQPVSAFSFVLSPGLDIKINTPKVVFKFNGRYTLRKFFERAVAENLDQFSNFRIRSSLDILPDAVVGIQIHENVTLQNRADDRQFFDNSLLTQLRNDLGGGLVFRVGPEFTIDTKVKWGYHNFRIPGIDRQQSFNNRNSISPALALNWRFFPKTAFVVEANVDVNRWQTNWVPTGESTGIASNAVRSYGEFLAIPDSTFVKAATGIRGRLTDHLVVTLMVGYGAGLYSTASVTDEINGNTGIANESDPATAGFDASVNTLQRVNPRTGNTEANTDGILATAKVAVDLGFSKQRKFGQQITVMYRKDFVDSFFTNYMHNHYVMGGLASRWGRFVGSNLSAAVRFENYYGEVTRNDIFLNLSGSVNIKPLPWFGIDLGASWVQRASSQNEVEYDNVLGRTMFTFTY